MFDRFVICIGRYNLIFVISVRLCSLKFSDIAALIPSPMKTLARLTPRSAISLIAGKLIVDMSPLKFISRPHFYFKFVEQIDGGPDALYDCS